MIRDRLARLTGSRGWISASHPAAVIARTEIRTGVRAVLDNTRQLAAFGLMALFVVQMQITTVWQALDVGESLVASDPPIEAVAGAFAGLLAVGIYSGIHQLSTGSDSAGVRPLLLTSVAPRSVVLGQTLAEYLKLLGLLGGLVALPLLAIGAGAATPLVPLVLVVGALPLLWGGLLVGHLAGLTIQTAYRRVPGARIVRGLVIGGLTLGAVIWWLQVVEAQRIGDAASNLLSITSIGPLQAYARTLLVPVGVSATPVDAVLALGVLLAVLATTAIVVRVEIAHDARERPERSASAGSRSVPIAIGSRPSLRLGWRYLVLGIRNPSRFSHLMFLLIMLVSVGGSALTNPSLLIQYAPEVGVVLATAVAGGAYCLNPLGDDRDQHSLVLTASPTLRPLLRARGVAGMVLASVVLALGLGVGLLDGRFLDVAGFLALAPVLFLASVGTALGFGAAVPSYEPNEDGGTIQPSSMATMPFLLGALVLGSVAVVLVLATIGGSSARLLAVGWGILLPTLAASGVLGYRYAVKRFDGLTLDAY